MSKELFTVSVSIDVELVVEAETLEEAAEIADKRCLDELENANISVRPRPFTEFDISDNEYGWDEDCAPLGSSRSIGEILRNRR